MDRIDEVALCRLQLPLRVPYRLAMGTLRHFDTILVETCVTERIGWGEATILTGYTDESIEQSWRLAGALAEQLVGMPVERAFEHLDRHFDNAPFTVTAFASSLESAQGYLHLDRPASVPILAVLHADEEAGIEREVEAAIADNYRTLKVKVGFEWAADLARVRLIQRIVAGRAMLRLDGNQGYERGDACAFATALDPRAIELFEQPCAAEDWHAALAVAKAASVPMMLDESIYGVEGIERAAQLRAARYIKLKLMKMGSARKLETALRRIRELGMEPVLGNGVATEIGCWAEACVAVKLIRNAGEMNGFLKTVAPLFTPPLRLESGAIQLEPGGLPQIDRANVERFTVARADARAPRARAG
jgi:L-Ala-D/L-Glu epimerase / N-acetyl-D-glutamate racemase